MFEDLFFSEEKKKSLEILRMCALPTNSNEYWWVRYPKRAVEEIYKMEENTNAGFFHKGGKLIWEEDIISNFKTSFLISIETNSKHPFFPPMAFVKEPKIECGETGHMYGNGSLCLFRPEEYSTSMSILDIRCMACSWCFCFEAYVNSGKWAGAEAPHIL